MKKLISLLAVVLMGCGGGGEIPPSPAPQTTQTKSWNSTYVQGTVASKLLICNDTLDTEEKFFNNTITGDWGTLAGLDGSTYLPDVTGVSTPFWSVSEGKLSFISEQPVMRDGFALLSKEKFLHTERIVVETTMDVEGKGEGAFAGIAIIAGEGDYREIAFRKSGNSFLINRVAPCEETTLVAGSDGKAKFTLEYIPSVGWNYYVDGVLVKQEQISEPSIALSGDAHIGLYFVAYGADGFIKGTVSEIGFTGVLSTD